MNVKILARVLKVAGFVVSLQVATMTMAGDDLVDFSGKDPTEDEIREALTPPAPMRPRAVRMGAAAAAGAATAPSAIAPQKASFDQITFELNSDRVSPKARAILDKLGRVLAGSELQAVTYSVEGHTDISGALDYNMSLSKRRAEAVKRYLADNYNISPSRLKPEGKGPTDLLDKDNPRSGKNRRVVFVPLTAPSQ